MKKKIDGGEFGEDYLPETHFIHETDEDEFSIGQCYDKLPAKKIVCNKCGSDKFIVGTGSYYTAIKCPNCKYEICIHSG